MRLFEEHGGTITPVKDGRRRGKTWWIFRKEGRKERRSKGEAEEEKMNRMKSKEGTTERRKKRNSSLVSDRGKEGVKVRRNWTKAR